MPEMKFEQVKIIKPEDTNIIIGQSHFIKTAEDLYEALTVAVPGIKFGLAFCESSAKRLIRAEGSDPELKKSAIKNAQAISAGHAFVILIKGSFPINVLNSVKQVEEVCSIYCATANAVEVIIAETGQGRGIMGIVDGLPPKGIEGEGDIKERRGFLRKIGYKL